MLIEERTRIQIKNELEYIMPQHDILKLLELFDKILQAECPIEELRGIKERYPDSVNTIFNPESSMSDVLGSLSDYLKVEALFKLILYYVQPDSYESRMQNVTGFMGVLKELNLNPTNENLG